MTLKAIIDNLDGVPEALKGYYEQNADSGKFVLKVEPVDGYALEDVTGLKTTLGKELTLRKKLEKDLAKFTDIDPDKAREAMSKFEELANIDPAKEADKIANSKFEAAKSQLLEKHTGEVKTRDERIDFLTKTVESLLIDAAATAAIAEAKGSVGLLLPHVRSHTRVKEADGKFTVEVIDTDGNTKIADAKGTAMDIKGLIAEMKASDEFGRAFDASGNTGSGKQPGAGSGDLSRQGNFGGSREERQAAIAAKFNLPRQ